MCPEFRPIISCNHACCEHVRWTEEGGLVVKMTNKTGDVSHKGYLVAAGPDFESCVLSHMDYHDTVGVIYDDLVANGNDLWVVVYGIADVYFMGSATAGDCARSQVTADAGSAGQAISESMSLPPHEIEKCLSGIGHVVETRTGAGLAKCILHFN